MDYKTRIMAVVMMLIIAINIPFMSFSEDVCDSHVWVDTNTQYMLRHEYNTESGHVYRYYKLIVCANCRVTDAVPANDPAAKDVVYPHSYTFRYNDLGHVDNTSLHRFIYKCSWSYCDFTCIKTVECDLDCQHYVFKKKHESE